ncbi:hypothetical protein PHYBOEH_008739 [Phytophthora boehmeriae]|uniref:Myb-like DNA-binding protein n=1 Tax=Phytophthora boehmeriae TaxID=109152 RepID=A0A8T1X2L9_9STRA|nr:hypothetical protein PHYBOEH_008739 [Phytophthora boehmeriae]
MTISRNVYNQLFEQAPSATGKEQVIRLRPTEAKAGAIVVSAKNKIKMWTKEEHELFLVALEKFPSGPWKKVADFIGTKTPRQTMTHAQKYRQKIHRRQRGLRNQKKSANSSSSNNTSTPNSPTAAAPAPVDTKADVAVDQKTLVSPYGVADLQLKQDTPKSAEGATTNDQLLNILAQQATTMQQKSPTQQVETATNVTVDAEATDAQVSPNSSLPSLAEILHLGETNEKEQDKDQEKDVGQDVDMKDVEEKEKESKQEEKRPAECKCSCKCGAHDAMKNEETPVEETTPRPQSEES